MRPRIGLEVRATDLRAVMIRSAGVIWHGTVELDEAASLDDSIEQLLGMRPQTGRGRPRLSVAVGFSRAQVKRLDGLPPMRARVQMTQLLREHAGAVFLSNVGATAIPEVFRAADGKWWGAAIDRAVIDAVMAGAARANIGVEAIAPTVCTLSRLHGAGSTMIDDGRATIVATMVGGEMHGLRRVSSSTEPRLIPEAIRYLGDDAAAYSGAYAAAVSSRHAPLMWTVQPTPAAAARARRVRAAVMVGSLGAACAAALVAPGVRAALIVRHARSSPFAGAALDRRVSLAKAELNRTTKLLSEVVQFDSSRGAVTRLVAQLAQSLPESTALVSLRVDSVEGTFIAVAPHVTDVLGEMASVDHIRNARIVGGVTHEAIAGTRVERAAFRFVRTQPSRRNSVGTTAHSESARK